MRSQGTQANHGGAISFNVAGIHSLANLDQKGLVGSMQSFHLAIKRKEDVPQRSMSITVELKTVIKLFETFREQERARSPMFLFWDECIRMVMMVLQFVKAEQTGICASISQQPLQRLRISSHMTGITIPRWIPVYLADMEPLQQKHPTVYQRFMEGDHVISRSSQPFSSVWTDMALEQSINLDSKSN